MSIKLGKVIRKLRKQKGMSLRGLAELVGVSYVNISYIENGRIETSQEVLKKISKALNYDLDKLLSLADQVDNEIKNIINKMPDEVPDFLRTAKNLSKSEWKELTEQIKKRRKK